MIRSQVRFNKRYFESWYGSFYCSLLSFLFLPTSRYRGWPSSTRGSLSSTTLCSRGVPLCYVESTTTKAKMSVSHELRTITGPVVLTTISAPLSSPDHRARIRNPWGAWTKSLWRFRRLAFVTGQNSHVLQAMSCRPLRQISDRFKSARRVGARSPGCQGISRRCGSRYWLERPCASILGVRRRPRFSPRPGGPQCCLLSLLAGSCPRGWCGCCIVGQG